MLDSSPADGEYINSDPEVTEDATENPLWLVAEAGETPNTNFPEEVAEAGEIGGRLTGYIDCWNCGAALPGPLTPQLPTPSAPKYIPESDPPPGPATPAMVAAGMAPGTGPPYENPRPALPPPGGRWGGLFDLDARVPPARARRASDDPRAELLARA